MRTDRLTLHKRILSALLTSLLLLFAGCAGAPRGVVAEWPGPELETGAIWPGAETPAPPEDTPPPSSLPGTDTPTAAYDPRNTWAIYWYLCGSDLESGGGLATIDIAEMLEVTLPENVKVVIQTGGASAWQNEVISAETTGRYLYEGDALLHIGEQPSSNMGDPNTLAQFLQFCNERYPADHQVVVFWNHGGGSLSGVIFDERYDFDSLTLPELKSAFAVAPAASGMYEIIGFDACLMATVDMADTLRGHARYMVASEELEYGGGWNYTGFMEAFANGGPASGAELGRAICDTFYTTCEADGCADMATLSVVDLEKAGALLAEYKRAGDEILLAGCRGRLPYLGAFGRAGHAAENYGGNNDEQGYYHMVDLGDFVKHLGADELTKLGNGQALLAALSECVVYQVKGRLRREASGLSCYYNYGGGADGGVNGIVAFRNIGTSKSLSIYYAYASFGFLSDSDAAYVEELAASAGQGGITPDQNLFAGWADDLHGIPITSDERGGWVISMAEEEAEAVAEVWLEIFQENTAAGGFVSLGYGLAVNFSWDGELRSWFPNGHDAIDGVFISIEPAGKTDDYHLWASPILLNGERYTLVIGHVHGQPTILGARKASPSVKNMAEKELRKLAPGDVVEPIFSVMETVDGNARAVEKTIGRITVTENTEITRQALPGGNYRVRFVMIDFTGNKYTSASAAYRQ